MSAVDTLEGLDLARVVFCGDVHGSLTTLNRVFGVAERFDAGAVVAVGDVGVLWPGDGRRLVAGMDRICERHGVPLVVVDGNHEGWPALQNLRSSPPGPVHLSDRVIWADRGSRWRWGGRTFGALGGARSVEWRTRTEGVDWFEDLEMPTEADARRLIDAGPLDVLVSHEAPVEAPLRGTWVFEQRWEQELAETPRRLVSQVIDGCAAKVNVHGHWHQFHDTPLDVGTSTCRVVGLSHDGDPEGETWAVLNLDDLSVISQRMLISAR